MPLFCRFTPSVNAATTEEGGTSQYHRGMPSILITVILEIGLTSTRWETLLAPQSNSLAPIIY